MDQKILTQQSQKAYANPNPNPPQTNTTTIGAHTNWDTGDTNINRDSQRDNIRRLFHTLGITTWAQKSLRLALGLCIPGNSTEQERGGLPPTTQYLGQQVEGPNQPIQGSGTLEAVVHQGMGPYHVPGPHEAGPSHWTADQFSPIYQHQTPNRIMESHYPNPTATLPPEMALSTNTDRSAFPLLQ